jgi:hypothetical protein
MESVSYLLMYFIGAGLILIEAHRQFTTTPVVERRGGYEILKDVSLDSLSPRHIYLRGFLFYNLIYLFIYILILGSWELGEWVVSAGNPGAGAQGRLPFDVPDQSFLDREGIGRPIYVAAAMIALLSMPMCARLEQALRIWAHQLSGIPHSIYKEISRLNQLDLSQISASIQADLQSALEARFPAAEQSPQLAQVRSDVTQIDLLAPAVVGAVRDQVWQQEAVLELTALIEKERQNLETLRAQIGDATVALPVIAVAALEERKNVSALFAVLFTRNRGYPVPDRDKVTSAVVEQLRHRPRDYEVNGLVLALLATLVFGMFVGIPLEILFSSQQKAVPFGEVFANDFSQRSSKVFQSVLTFVLVFGIALMFALTQRKSRLLEGRWAPYRFNQLPVLRFVVAALPSLMSAFAVGLVLPVAMLMVKLALTGQEMPDADGLKGTFVIAAPYALVYGLLSLIMSAAVFLITDFHFRLPSHKTVAIGVSSAALVLLLHIFLLIPLTGGSFTQIIREAMPMFTAALLLLGFFAACLEWSEDR